ncbi:MAG: hypothetical protein DMG46_12855 [Acidobacteria bacterium]|jgi:hypothetical protein|nr:MAG: hypothetical protein DMG46_12855 [Acidobacteriota bacterium]
MKFKRTEVFLFLFGNLILMGVLTLRLPPATGSPHISIISVADGTEPPPPPLPPKPAAVTTPGLIADGTEPPPPPIPKPPLAALAG